MEKLNFKIGDAVIIAFVALAAVLLIIFFASENRQACNCRIYLEGKLIKTLPLNIDTEYTINGEYTNTVTVKNGKCAVTYSNCPGCDCVASGFKSKAGSSIICLPNRMEVRLTGEDIDSVAY